MKTMRGIWLTGHGGFEQLDYRTDIPVPEPGSHDVRIQVAAAGVNNTDINTRTGWYSKTEDSDTNWAGEAFQFPRIQGADVCGTIVAVGSNVDASRVGQRVIVEPVLREKNGQPLDPPWYYGSEIDGGFAEYTVVPARHAFAIDSPLTDIELASFPCSYSTAENMLQRAQIGAGDRILVTGASGGVGSAAVQLAKVRGAYVIAVTQAEKAQALRDIGADEIVLRGTSYLDALGRNSLDGVIDLVAGKQWPELLEVLKPGSRYAVSGAIAGAMVELDVRTLYLKDLTLLGCTIIDPDVFGNLVAHIESGRIKPLIAATYPLEEIQAAQTAFEAKQHIGKIVLGVATTKI